MEFIVKPNIKYPSNYSIKGPCILLLDDRWDDYGYKTLFHAYYVTNTGELKDLSSVRILHKSDTSTSLLDSFSELSDEYCSLGSSMDYYEKLSKLGSGICNSVLRALNDAAIYEDVRNEFKNHEGFLDSLLRNGRNALNNAKAYLEETEIKNRYTFTYSTQLPDALNEHRVKFSFFRNDGIPYRVYAIIGKNGTGKTRYLADLTSDLTSDFKKNQGKFEGLRPDFGMILSLSYSAFTKFQKKTEDSANNIMYKNFGALDDENKFNADVMEKNLRESIERIVEFGREEFWLETLRDLQSDEFVNTIERLIIREGKFHRLSELSSGQRMIFEIITNIIANVRLNTLIIFDEPEIHLHPNAIANLMKALYLVLDEFDSFAILATHVPHVIQQIPSDSVVVFDRVGQTAIVRGLGFESFGENLSELTSGVFETNNVFDNYKNVLRKLANELEYDDIIKLFHNKLPLNARIFLKACYDEV